MEQGFPTALPKWAERLLRLVPRQQRRLLAIAFLIPLLTAIVAAALHLTAVGEPSLQLHAAYLKGFLMYFSVVVVTLLVGRAVWLAIRPASRDGKADGQ